MVHGMQPCQAEPLNPEPLNPETRTDNMEKFRIKVLNKIAPEGLSLLDDHYSVDSDEKDPH